jgi:hypothetical protein
MPVDALSNLPFGLAVFSNLPIWSSDLLFAELQCAVSLPLVEGDARVFLWKLYLCDCSPVTLIGVHILHPVRVDG